MLRTQPLTDFKPGITVLALGYEAPRRPLAAGFLLFRRSCTISPPGWHGLSQDSVRGGSSIEIKAGWMDTRRKT
jgi:hypothetical protein